MRRLLPALSYVARFVVLGLALAFVLLLARPEIGQRLRASLGVPAGADSSGRPAPSFAGPASYRDAVRHAAPSVVSIFTARVVTEAPRILMPNSVLQRFSGVTIGPPRRRLERALGSGVIVSEDGYVLTNNHVIETADEIQVVVEGRPPTTARVVGSDPDTDLAVLKIDASHLPAMRLDDVDTAVGDVVLAIGNPLGLGQTVTQGIVSGLGRNQLNLSTYEDFIQTDAAINNGNSGGALVTARGELIGINTFVVGRAEGIGFAIPTATARAVLQQIIDHGMVVRGWLGIEYGDAPVLPGGLPPGTPRGVAVTMVYPGGPADRVGLRPGDVLLAIDGREIADQNDLRDNEAARDPGSTVTLSGLRAGVPFEVEVTLTQRPRPQRREF